MMLVVMNTAMLCWVVVQKLNDDDDAILNLGGVNNENVAQSDKNILE